MKNSPDVDFLIFDLGNVIIDIDYQRSLSLIKSKLEESIHDRVDIFYQTEFHKSYEKGLISSIQFRDEVRNYFDQPWTDQEIDMLWNSLLGKIPPQRLDLVRALRKKYQVGVLSNTNEIHIDAVHEMLRTEHGLDRFDPIFDWVFYSHEMGLAKPSAEIYEKMLVELNTSPDRVLFFDDLKANVEGAKAVGIQAIQVTNPRVIFEFFSNV
ncbi:HAD family phosphatase [Algoriphagus confluentis]|uniref:HAD family phosphatase n=1 Tax=Algoriphagus confluentis TaxID=1697556 RepID=A0ABQ6PQ64_9BACT|nr:HAD family phosphatase [Algoriphagus confluentis]